MKIINVDKMEVIGEFEPWEADEKIKELEDDGWKDVSIDHDGDITVWEE